MKKIFLSIVLTVVFLGFYTINAGPYLEKVYIGPIVQSRFELELEGNLYPIYECLGELFIPIQYVDDTPENEKEVKSIIDQHAYLSNKPVFVGNLRTYNLIVEDMYLVPLQTLRVKWDLAIEGSHYKVTPKMENYDQYFKMDDHTIINESQHPFWIHYKLLYLKNNSIQYEEHGPILIEGGQVLNIEHANEKGIYLTMYLTKVNEWVDGAATSDVYGQENALIYGMHYNHVRLQALEKVFPPFIVKGKIRYAVGPFEKGEEAEVWRSEKRSYVVIKDKNGKKYNVSPGAIDIPSETWIPAPQVKKEDIEDYINLKRLESSTGYFVWTDLCRQRTYVFKGKVGEWRLEKTLICSSGKNSSLTPRGTYKMLYQVPYFGEERGYRCKNGVVLYRDYMYHSILFDKTGKYPKESVYQLGKRKSHGCIRLSEADSEWLYKMVPLDTTVWIN